MKTKLGWFFCFIAIVACNPPTLDVFAGPDEGSERERKAVPQEKTSRAISVTLAHFSIGKGINLYPLDSAPLGLTSNAIALLPDGSIGGVQMAQCAPDVKGRWVLQSDTLQLDFKEIYELDVCLGVRPPFRSKPFVVIIVELECISEDGGTAWGTAVTAKGQKFQVMCGEY